ncbi:unnamed protein product [Schistosoma mattheei]|uniref:Uncharacterized protein n=1 Tax=Schistosoma mattheei TaxID=31246 RepID=A0A3P8BTH7_9TREM|nr:unnamed protein product [Schistosoma mattheei]
MTMVRNLQVFVIALILTKNSRNCTFLRFLPCTSKSRK